MSIRIQNLAKTFVQSTVKIEVLRNLNLEIQKQQKVAILGQSGSGKSTFLSLMAGLERPDFGSIFIDNTDLAALGEKERTQFRAKNISIVFQQYHLVSHLTALENIMLPLEILKHENAHARAMALLEEMNLSHRISHFPHQLSGGECQRVAIARALVVEPSLILADEPSGNLDLETGDKVMDVFFEITNKHKSTVLLVTHSPALAQRCDRMVYLKNGIFVEENA